MVSVMAAAPESNVSWAWLLVSLVTVILGAWAHHSQLRLLELALEKGGRRVAVVVALGVMLILWMGGHPTVPPINLADAPPGSHQVQGGGGH